MIPIKNSVNLVRIFFFFQKKTKNKKQKRKEKKVMINQGTVRVGEEKRSSKEVEEFRERSIELDLGWSNDSEPDEEDE